LTGRANRPEEQNMRCYELDVGVHRTMTSHIEVCATCRKHLLDFERIDVLVIGKPKLEVSPAFGKQVVAKERERVRD
jgi:hypothetical protein